MIFDGEPLDSMRLGTYNNYEWCTCMRVPE